MTLNKSLLSAAAIAVLSTSAIAGTLTYTGTNSTYVVATEIYLGTADINNTMDMNNTLTYKTASLPSGTVTEPAITIEFPTGVKAFATTDANITLLSDSSYTLGTLKASSNGTNQLIFDKVAGQSLNSNTDLNITGGLTVEFPDGTTSTTATLKVGYSTDPSTADEGTVSLITAVDQVSASMTATFNGFIDAANSFKLLVDSAGANAPTDTATVSFDMDPAGIDNAIATADGTTISTSILPDNNVSVAGTMSTLAANDGQTQAALVQGADNNYTSGMSVITVDAVDETVRYSFSPTGVNGTNQIATTTFTANVIATFPAGTKSLLTSASAGAWSIYGYSAQIPNVSGLSTHDTTMKFTNSSTTAAEIYFTLIDPDGTEVTLDSVNDGLTSLGVNVTGTYKASALVALITDTNFDSTGSFSVEVSIPTTPNSVYGMASFKNTALGQFKDLPVYNSSTNSY